MFPNSREGKQAPTTPPMFQDASTQTVPPAPFQKPIAVITRPATRPVTRPASIVGGYHSHPLSNIAS